MQFNQPFQQHSPQQQAGSGYPPPSQQGYPPPGAVSSPFAQPPPPSGVSSPFAQPPVGPGPTGPFYGRPAPGVNPVMQPFSQPPQYPPMSQPHAPPTSAPPTAGFSREPPPTSGAAPVRPPMPAMAASGSYGAPPMNPSMPLGAPPMNPSMPLGAPPMNPSMPLGAPPTAPPLGPPPVAPPLGPPPLGPPAAASAGPPPLGPSGGYASQQAAAMGPPTVPLAGLQIGATPPPGPYQQPPPMQQQHFQPPPPQFQQPPPPQFHQAAPPQFQQQQQPQQQMAAPPDGSGGRPLTGIVPTGPGTPLVQSPSGSSSSKINPSQVPSPTTLDTKPQRYATRSGTVPPAVSAPLSVIDDGFCSPRFMRASCYNLPHSSDLAKLAGIPLVAHVQPMAQLAPDESPLPVVELGSAGPVRCVRCRAYINALAVFCNGGRQYVCRLCEAVNDVPPDYFSPLDAAGRRADLAQRPELCRGSVEFRTTNPDYVLHDGQAPAVPTYLFAIDVSYPALASGATQAAIQGVRLLLSELEADQSGERDVRVGLLTFDSSVHFWALNKLPTAQMKVVADVDDVFVPVAAQQLFGSYRRNRDTIVALLDKLVSMFSQSTDAGSVFGAALHAGHLALREAGGGKVICVLSSLPSIGPGALKRREEPRWVGTDKERVLYKPQDAFYATLGAECVKSRVAVDVFVLAAGARFVDVASIGELPRETGGELFYYSGFSGTKRESDKVARDIVRDVLRPTAWDAVVKVRTSRGLAVVEQLGAGQLSSAEAGSELQFAALDSDKSVLVSLRHDDQPLDDKHEAVVQCAMLYTTSDGERRIRVHTLGLGVTSALPAVFRGADLDSIVNALLRQAVSNVPQAASVAAVSAQLTEHAVAMLHAYRRHCATSSSSGQLILPESLKLLPVFVLAMQKHSLLRPGQEITQDERAALLGSFRSAGPWVTTPSVYPRLYAANQVVPVGPQEPARLPVPLRLSQDSLNADGAYLLDDGSSTIWLWLGKQLSPRFVSELFNAQLTVDQVPIGPETVLEPHPTDASAYVHGLIASIRAQRGPAAPWMSVRVAKQSHVSELRFLYYLVEDRLQDAPSYVDFLCNVHKMIQTKLS
eukprot:TRINITY_DN425_c2_g1_i2.p1 TRINITY_DN425_c2_g1~~TRINITY_DN425_c2_g1_i2.p1  ORF type:complete len:1097 (-),score=398.97 TRINITY_DN425_c2_g1_i2:225-3515(-)